MKNVEDIYPLSPLQHGLLYQSIAAPASAVGFQQSSCTLEGELDLGVFELVWQSVVDQHSILRTAFLWEGLDEPLQIVRQKAKLPLQIQDWRHLSAAEQGRALEAFLQEDRGRGFHLSKAPLMRLKLIRLAENVHQFVWSFHHLLLDGWCHSLLLREVFALYEALSQGRDLRLERPRPYKDYIDWLRRQDQSKAEAFWRRMFRGINAPTTLRLDRPSHQPAAAAEEYASRQLRLSAEMTDAVRSFARRNQLTLNTLAVGAWALLLSCYSGEESVVTGVTVSGRPADLAGADSIMGMFINNLPLRVDVPQRARLLHWLKRVQEQQAELRQYEFSSPMQVHEWSGVGWGERLFDHLVIFENYPVDASVARQRTGLKISNSSDYLKTNHSLTLLVEPSRELHLQIFYDCRRFDEETAGRILRRYRELLEGIVLNPACVLSDLSADARRYATGGEVEVRGHRIGLGEIEAALAQHEAVRQAVVVAREDMSGERRLVAYLTPGDGPKPTFGELRRFLLQTLPKYMIPSAFVALEEFPLTHDGRIDRSALPSPEQAAAASLQAPPAPRDTLELRLVQIWEELFGISPVGITDDFFELGGHSLLAMRLIARLREQFGHSLKLSDLLQGATIEQLAGSIRQQAGADSASPLVKIQPGDSRPPFFCVHPGGGSVLCYVDLARCLGARQPFYGLQIPQLDAADDRHPSIEEMAARYIAALRMARPEGPYSLGGYSFGGIVAFEMARQLQREGHDVAEVILLDTWSPARTGEIFRLEDSLGIDDFIEMAIAANRRARAQGRRPPFSLAELWRREPHERLDYGLPVADAANLLLPGVGLPEIRRYLEGVKARKLAVRSYAPQVYEGRLVLLRTRELDRSFLDELREVADATLLERLRAAQDAVFSDPTYHWDELSSAPVEVQDVPGNHHTMLSEPHVRVVAERLRNYLLKTEVGELLCS